MESLPQKRVRWVNSGVEVDVDVDVAVKVPVRVRVSAVIVAILAAPVIIGSIAVACGLTSRIATVVSSPPVVRDGLHTSLPLS
jgi:hypothetical protein